jgi:hypothetical protein
MKYKKITITLILAMCLLGTFTTHAQLGDTGQKLQISQGPVVLGTFDLMGRNSANSTASELPINAPFPLKFRSLDSMPATVGNRRCEGLVTGECGWYKAFWIFGDGNYYKPGNFDTDMDVPTLSVDNYLYTQSGIYQPVVYLTEKYHNTKPPDAARAIINVSGTAATGIYLERPQNLGSANDRKLHIDYNHQPRIDYPMNLVVSYRRSDDIHALLVYYNSLSNNTFSLFEPTQLFTYITNEWTNYQGKGYAPKSDFDLSTTSFERLKKENLLRFEPSILDGLNSKFKSRLIYDSLSLFSNLPPNMTEMRVFPVLKTGGLSSMPPGLLVDTPITRFPCFAAISIGTTPVDPLDPAYGRLLQNAQVLFGPLNSLQLGPNIPLYVKGIELLNLPLLTSHDPNTLDVVEVTDHGNGQYLVKFRMTICNNGEVPETNPTLTFNDLTGGRYSSKPELLNLRSNVNPSWSGGSGSRPWNVSMNGFIIAGTPNSSAPSCSELFFTITTDQAGVARLYEKEPRALKVCVTFSTGIGDCSENEILKKDPIPDTCCKMIDGGILCYLIIAILLAILFWFIWRGYRS